jgi:Flp pilus assembly protein TadG
MITRCTRHVDWRRIANSRMRRGTAVVELAVLLPLLILLFMITIDFARAYYFSLTLANCARAGAFFACDPSTADESPFASVEAAALSDAANLSPQPTISTISGVDAQGRAVVSVTAEYAFRTLGRFPGTPREVLLRRTVTMSRCASIPNEN